MSAPMRRSMLRALLASLVLSAGEQVVVALGARPVPMWLHVIVSGVVGLGIGWMDACHHYRATSETP